MPSPKDKHEAELLERVAPPHRAEVSGLYAAYVATAGGQAEPAGIVDHSARPEDGIAETESFHRIAGSNLIAEIKAAGFVLDASADFLRNPDDPRDWNDSPRAAAERRGTSDRFVLRFKKPR